MMKKLTPKSKISTCLVLLCLFLTQACRKDTLMPHSKDLQNGLSIAEAKSYFDKNIASLKKPDKLMSTGSGAQNSGEITLEYVLGVRQPLWEQAYQKMISTGESVKIPIDFGKAYAVVNPKTNAVVPLASLNYLFMYKDTLQKVHAEWIILQPDSAWLYGNRDKYTGHIIVKNWEGKTIRKINYSNLKTINSSSTIKGRLLSSNGKIQNSDGGENQVDDVVGFCTRWSTGKCPKTGVCATTCDMCLEVCARWTCTFFDCSPECDLPDESGGGGGGGKSGGGGGGSKPWAPGGGGAYPPDPCGGGQVIPREGQGEVIENVVPLPPCIPIPVVLESVAKSTLIEKIGISVNSLESIYLSSQPEIVDALLLYLSTNGESAENINFANWAVAYLMENPSVNFEDFERDFLTKDVGLDTSGLGTDASGQDMNYSIYFDNVDEDFKVISKNDPNYNNVINNGTTSLPINFAPCTTQGLRQMGRDKGWDVGVSPLEFNRRVGQAFQEAAFKLYSQKLLPPQRLRVKYQPQNNISLWRRDKVGNTGQVVPDWTYDINFMGISVPLSQHWFYDAKAVTGFLYLSSSKYQIGGYLDVLSKKKVPNAPPPALVFVTPVNTIISPSVLFAANKVGVQVRQAFVVIINNQLYLLNSIEITPTNDKFTNIPTNMLKILSGPVDLEWPVNPNNGPDYEQVQ